MITIVAAVSENGVIGNAGKLPWHIPEDLLHFKALTYRKAVIMGRKTFESLGEALPGRRNIVLTRKRGWSADNATVVRSVTDALMTMHRTSELFVVGGAEIYEQFLSERRVDKMIISEIPGSYDGDTYFPKHNMRLQSRVPHAAFCVATYI